MFELKTLLERCAEYDASDLHLKAGSPPMLRIDGELVPQGTTPVTDDDTERFLDEILPPEQKARVGIDCDAPDQVGYTGF